MITRILLTSLITTLIFTAPGLADDSLQSRNDWQTHFDKYEAVGTVLIVDHRGEVPTMSVYDEARAGTPYPPASTYKIPHALFGLAAGVVRDEFHVFEWDGVERSYAPWNRDQTLRSSMRYSTIWVYERIAAELGEDKARTYLEAADYGNADPTPAAEAPGNEEPYWVTGNIRITAAQQVAFLEKLYRNELPFEVGHQRLVKDIMINEAGRDWVLRAKTGWTGQLGWWVGWVEHADGPVFFALNIDTPNRYDDLYKREAITRDVLRSIGALPGEE